MRRRRVLTGALAAVALAGCGSRPPTDGPGTSPSPAGTGTALVGSEFRVRSSECGRQVDAASVSFDPAAPAVAVNGTVWGPDTCHTARLAGATYAPDADRLDVRVVAARRETTGTPACAQCIVEVAYAATCAFAGGLPGRVRVVHGRGERERVVTTAER
ncbi:MAG: hypothetical protein ABEH40_08140 [Haloferacaceae archaeon]